MPVPPLAGVHKRPLLRDNVFESLRNAIVDGTFEPGERLKDTELEAWLGVSRTPIREALLRLERAGLVIALPGKAHLDRGGERRHRVVGVAAARSPVRAHLRAPGQLASIRSVASRTVASSRPRRATVVRPRSASSTVSAHS